jgi:hypothetical protein
VGLGSGLDRCGKSHSSSYGFEITLDMRELFAHGTLAVLQAVKRVALSTSGVLEVRHFCFLVR